MKKCSQCGETKAEIEYYVDRRTTSGLYSSCKECFARKRAKPRKERILMTKEERKESLRKYSRSFAVRYAEKNKENPEFQLKIKARKKVRNAVAYGLMNKGICIECGEEKVDAHHPDYSKPLEVVWLCRLHHKHLHMGKLTLSITEPV